MRILLAEDDPIQLNVFGRFLASRGHSVDVAITADRAYDLLKSGRYDVAVVDLLFGITTGFNIALEAARDGSAVILMSGLPQADLDEQRGKLAVLGIVATTVKKPFEPETLAALIESSAPPSMTADRPSP